MSQALVTDFFNTRKRNRFQDEALINKSRKAAAAQLGDQMIEEPTKRCLRSSRLKGVQASECEPLATKTVVETPPPLLQQPETTKPTRRATRNSEKKDNMEALKARIRRLDDAKARVLPPSSVESQPQKPETEPTAPVSEAVTTKKRVNKAELKRRIEEFNRNLNQLQEEQCKQKQEEQSAREHAKATETPAQQLPAYSKSKDLASEQIDLSSTLTLPKAYAMLLDCFKGSDTIVKFLFNRDEVCTFLKLKMGIQNITKQTFAHKHLAQLKTVYPEAYSLRYEKLFIDFKNDHHLIISPNMNEIETNPETGTKQFTPAVLIKRLAKFKSNLFAIVKKFHQEFLESIGIKDVSSESLRRWHPKFELENLKEVEQAELPKPPNDESIKCKTGQELLNIARDIYSSRIQDAIKKSVPEPEKETPKEKKENDEIAKPATIELKVTLEQTATELEKKVTETKQATQQYSSLLEKIRNKEKQKAFESMVIHSDKEKKLVRYRVYAEATRFLINFFQAEKKTTLDMDKVSRKMSENLKTSALNDLECRELLIEMSGAESIFAAGGKKWLNVIKVRGQSYLQLDKANAQINELSDICEQAMAKLN